MQSFVTSHAAVGQQRKDGLVACTQERSSVEARERGPAQLGVDEVELRQVRARRMDVFPAVALRPAPFAHPARPGLEPANAILNGEA